MQTKIEAVQEMNTKYARQVRDLKRQTTELLAYAPVDDKLQLAVKEEEEYKYRRLTAASSVVLLT